MRYYTVFLPGKDRKDPIVTSNVRRLRNLPEGTHIEANVTDRDGTLIDIWEIPVANGRAQVSGEGKHRPKYTSRGRM
jgi:hypothetical protein